jgi:ribose-phosphate pyrophosphokinase
MSAAIFTFEECAAPAARLATELSIDCRMVTVHRFPDGESKVTVPQAASVALLYRSLDDPNAKLVELILAAAALRDRGAERVVLLAPYLAYMRQDIAFHEGEAVSQRVIGQLLASHFDGLVTIDPHLHRISRLDEAVPGIPAIAISAAPALARALDGLESQVLIGPDLESRQWVEAIAAPRSLAVLVGEKQRKGDRDVELAIPDAQIVDGRPVVLVDDVISSGRTLIAAAGLLREAGASRIEALATHCLARPPDLALLAGAGIERIRSTDSVAGSTACIPVATILAKAIREQGWST